MNNKEVTIRKIKKSEKKYVKKLARITYLGLESLFVSNFNNAFVALIDDEIVGGINYKIIKCQNKKIAYISDAFVDKSYQNQNIGKKLYNETIKFLEETYDGVITIVREDNIKSSKLLENNKLKKVGFNEIIYNFGFINAIKFYFTTFTWLAVGYDIYLKINDKKIIEKNSSLTQIIWFFILNLILALPLWLTIHSNIDNLNITILAYLTILTIFILIRYIGFKTTKEKGKFRINNGGILINLLVSLLGFPYLINGNWYPNKYQNTKEFNEKLARPELIKWFIFLFLPFLYFTSSAYLKELAQISFVYLILFVIPIYPFSYFGGKRIYNYSKKIWVIVLVMTLIMVTMMYKFTLI